LLLLTYGFIVCTFSISTYTHPMKKLLTFLVIVFFVGQTGAQTTEYLQQKDFNVEKKKIYESINASRKQLNEVKKAETKIRLSLDSTKRALEINTGQLIRINDSLTNTNAKLNSLKENFDGQKLLPRKVLILLFIIIFILFVIIFFIQILFKKKADTNYQSIVDQDKKTNERLDIEIKRLVGDMQTNLETVSQLSAEMSQKISTALTSLEAKNQQLEKQLKDDLSRIELKFSTFTPEISKLKEEYFQATRNLEERLQTIKRDTELLNKDFTDRSAKLEEEVKLLKGKK
jgi:hypothetical protein